MKSFAFDKLCWKSNMMQRRAPRGGYVLVLTLGIVALAAISLGGLARYSLGVAAEAHRAAADLQHRWGLLSVQHVLLEGAPDIFAIPVARNESDSPRWPSPASVPTTFRLGSLTIEAVVADEDAKLNINTIYGREPGRVPTILRRVMADASGFPVRLAPMTTTKAPFCSWGQVWDLNHADCDEDLSTCLMQATGEITCWGSGRLNLCTASDDAIREVAHTALPAQKVGELLTLRKTWGGVAIDDLLSQLDLRQPQLLAARRLFSSESRSYSLWVRLDNGARSWSYQYINDGGINCFAW
jgi:hypothetical protein